MEPCSHCCCLTAAALCTVAPTRLTGLPIRSASLQELWKRRPEDLLGIQFPEPFPTVPAGPKLAGPPLFCICCCLTDSALPLFMFKAPAAPPLSSTSTHRPPV